MIYQNKNFNLRRISQSEIRKIAAAKKEAAKARAGKKEGGWEEGIFARPRFPPPPNFAPVKLARRLKLLSLTIATTFQQKVAILKIFQSANCAQQKSA